MLSTLIAAEDEGDRLTHEELLINLILLLIAGHETTSNLIGNGALALCDNPSVRDEFAANPDELARTAVDEFLRYDAPVQFTVRTAMQDVEFDGITLPKGLQAMLMLAGANRDPAVMPNPEQFDLRNTETMNFAFGHGMHRCVGAELARMELRTALTALARRFPHLAMATDDPGELGFRDLSIVYGLDRLPVRLDSALDRV